MKLHFYLRYRTQVGQSLRVHSLEKDTPLDLELTYLNEEWWHGTASFDARKLPATLRYQYLLIENNGTETADWDADRSLDLKNAGCDLRCLDHWNPAGAVENAFFTQPFRDIFMKNGAVPGKKNTANASHVFRVKAPALASTEQICLLGEPTELSAWDTKSPILLEKIGNWWSASVELSGADFPLAYKYGVWDFSKKQFSRWESGDNRLLFGQADPNLRTFLHDGFARLGEVRWRGAGVAIPVFSLRGEKSFGCGEFTDLPKLADWAKNCGLRVIQLLPINDTSATGKFTDSYPYAAVSAFALHPMYLDIFEVAGKKDADLVKSFLKKQKTLNSGQTVDYELVMSEKRAAAELLFVRQKDGFLLEKGWLDFFEKNREWLQPYAAFTFLKEKNGTADFSKWATNAVFSKKEIEKLTAPGARDFEKIAFHFFVQYQLHLQLSAATEYCHAQGLMLKGDIPIGIYRYSCDAWVAPDLYNMNAQAGAPPDDFAEKGQNWGFPTYDWARMKSDGFAWWRARFEQMSAYFDAFRIDHILGFFRIWAIPLDAVEGILGRFDPCLPVSEREFLQNEIPFDRDRFCRPYITDAVLAETFADHADRDLVKMQCLDRRPDGLFDLKPEFANQRAVESFFEKQEMTSQAGALKQGLFDLITNVILFERTDGSGFDFRYGIEKISSFLHLPKTLQSRLNSLYINYFYQRQDNFWLAEAMEKLPALKRSTKMLICGEDLGMVPGCVPGVMQDLGILSLEIQRMPKAAGHAFFHPKDAPYLSVVTPSTHDMSTIRGWWEEDRAVSQRFFNEIMGQDGAAPYFCEPWINRVVVAQHLNSPAMWGIFQLQDLMGMDGDLRRESPEDERINVPANPKHYWRYRMHLTLEELAGEASFNAGLKDMVFESGRG